MDDALKNRLKELKNTTGILETGLASARKTYENLNHKLEQLGKSNVFAFIGMEPGAEVPREDLLLNEVVRDILNSFKSKLKPKGVYYIISISHTEIWKENKESFGRILKNIFDNATKYSIRNTTLTINADRYRLSVTNRCVYDEHLQGDWPFTYGKRGKVARSGNENGSGYGLSIVKLFCDEIVNWDCIFKQNRIVNTEFAEFVITFNRRRS